MDAEHSALKEEVQQCLRQCRHGFFLRRVKNGKIGSPARVWIQDDKHFCYHSQGLWALFPVKHKSVEIHELFEVRTGFSTDNLHYAATKRSFREVASEAVCFSVIFTRKAFLHKSVDFVADSSKICNTFFVALEYLINTKKKERLFFDEKRWIVEKFREADTDKSGKLCFRELWKLLKELNLGLNEHYAKALFMDADTNKTLAGSGDNLLDEDEFANFFTRLTKRTDLEEILRIHSSSHEHTFTLGDLRRFLITEQQSERDLVVIRSLCDQRFYSIYGGPRKVEQVKAAPNLRSSFAITTGEGALSSVTKQTVGGEEPGLNVQGSVARFPYIDEVKARTILETFETGKQEGQQHKLMGPIGFRQLLQSEYGKVIKPGHERVFQDMNHPLNHYFINSSHNTYITGMQLAGGATVEGYIKALKRGVRLLELDVFDGDHGLPCITHKRSLIAAITLRDALTAIERYAFKASPYPVILTIENHAGLTQQKVMARIFKEILGERLYIRPTDAATRPLPSPNSLKHKFILRGRKLQNESSRDNLSRGSEKKESDEELDVDYSQLISIPFVKLSTNIYEDMQKHPVDGSCSLSEGKVDSIFNSSLPIAAYTATRLVKSYPSGLRQDSSNLEPMTSWICGIQCVAMNMQTSGKSLDLNTAMFRINGNCGYVLKPDFLLKGIDPRSPEALLSYPMRLSVRIISGQYLPKPNPSEDIVDPYVTVETFGIPDDGRRYDSRTISNNGFNPQWNETFNFDLKCPQMAFLRLCVKDHDNRSDDFIGEFSVPISSIRSGYSHVRLNTGYAHTPDPSASLLVHIAMR
ncbi:1-phosphatidylinositol 4,5-bisphosphate phosphodiesterase delta-3-A [Toxocara canis]|uniref:Phosphoinositide phospholipase C n=1 Tax=Toxocara canis TaxID=6265 RepID=A0A0B2VQE4_TOXCA|nr:1-phosphatidylinositol 4,5-bisphosphate phosphodiesterase delta-3-A [Toxocara canis]